MADNPRGTGRELPNSPLGQLEILYLTSKQHGEFLIDMNGRRYWDVFVILYEYAAKLEKLMKSGT